MNAAPKMGPSLYRTTCHSMLGAVRRSQNNPAFAGKAFGWGACSGLECRGSRFGRSCALEGRSQAEAAELCSGGQPRRLSPHESLLHKKKRPELFSSGRLGSPPPELPNHEMDSRELAIRCKRHFGNRFFPVSESALNRKARAAFRCIELSGALTSRCARPDGRGGGPHIYTRPQESMVACARSGRRRV